MQLGIAYKISLIFRWPSFESDSENSAKFYKNHEKKLY